MKVALVVPGGVDESGTERVIPAVLWLVERLARRHDVHVFALSQEAAPREWPLLGASVHNVGTIGAHRRRFLELFARAHRAAPFRIVHAIFGGVGLHALVAGKRHGIPVVTHLAGGELVSIPEAGYGSQTRQRDRLRLRVVTSWSDRVTVATPFMQQLADRFDVRTTLVPLGVALDRWPVRPPRPRDRSRPARLLHVADLRPVKDQPTLLAAAVLLRARGVSFELHLAGFDTMHGALRQSADARALADVVHWHGLLGRRPLYELMSDSDLLVHPSRHEAGPLAALEAAVVGVPTIGTPVGHIAEWAPDAALATPVGDAEALARGIESLLGDEPRRLAMASAAQSRAVAIDADYTAASFERIYDDVLRGRGAR
jgi:glycosyltransferase involved in cell wall biosynthesis